MGKKWRYGIVFDAGSSGTRLYVYKWKDHAKAIKHASVEESQSLPKIKLQKVEKVQPGVSSFAKKPDDVGPEHLQSLVDIALKHVPEKKVPDTPVYVMATAGSLCPTATPISRSSRIAFAPNVTEAERHADDLKLVRLRTMDGSSIEHRVFTATWLGYGANQARERYVDSLKEQYGQPDNLEIPDPCLPSGLRTTIAGDPVVGEPAHKQLSLVGTGQFDECLRQTEPLLGKDAPCKDEPCLLNGQHVPSIDFEINHFVGVSEYWHTTHGVFGNGPKMTYDLATYQKNVVDFCSRDWAEIEATIAARKKSAVRKAKNAQEACFKASWLINVLYEDKVKEKGFSDPFQPVNKIDGVEVSWTLGKIVLYAAGQVPPKSSALPVGFGSNVADGADFELAGSQHSPMDGGDEDDDWDDAADDLLDTAKSKSGSDRQLPTSAF
ncbi:Golgi apyrase [Colletotrichum orbiculare MAFF 240422]|uniref:Golgi apyrase n=1 Tax=Colletotrichum orbiculare (strain 104-T / ATCC 96160 / CBS 514.97 / LARS 414 / MAFF 240422) TaxID=1213857 RepID=A0A484FI70_COLOR|nr:Golgi apyrase [Colletotrichum orbiculare MAFF 240422]